LGTHLLLREHVRLRPFRSAKSKEGVDSRPRIGRGGLSGHNNARLHFSDHFDKLHGELSLEDALIGVRLVHLEKKRNNPSFGPLM
jgi:hypothetical protein